MIYTLTLNPAIDKIIYLSAFEKNVTNRMKDSTTTLGGKGTHVSINLKLMGIENAAFGVCFGSTGSEVIEILKDNGIHTYFLHGEEGNTRTNYLLIEDSGDCTIIADKGPELNDELLKKLNTSMLGQIAEGDILVVSGDASNCANPRIYVELLEALQDRALKVFVDTSGKSLEECVRTSPFLIKPNLDELSCLTGASTESLQSDAGIIEAIESLNPYGIEVVAVSMGGAGSLVKWGNGFYRVTPPDVKVRNTIGCGDCFLSGLIAGHTQGMTIEDTLRYATAVSSATAESSLSVGFDHGHAEQLLERVEIAKIR